MPSLWDKLYWLRNECTRQRLACNFPAVVELTRQIDAINAQLDAEATP